MKKLLFVVNVDWFFVSHRLPIAQYALSRGYEVHLATSFTDHKDELEKIGVICHDVSFSRSGNAVINEAQVLVSLRAIIKHVRPTVVHAVTIKPVLYSGLILRTLIKPPAFVAAISGLGYVFTAENLRARVTKALVSQLYKIAMANSNKTVIFQNSSDENILTNIVGLSPRDKTLIKGSGADLDVYKVSEEPDSPPIVITMACRLLKEKGVYEFVNAAKLLKPKYPNVIFQLVGGTDPDNPNSVSQSETIRWEGEGIIRALGHRTDIPEIFMGSHIVTMPSFYGEGVPKVLIEAAACARPIVTTDNPGCRDAIVSNVTGILVPIKDSVSLANAFEKLILDGDLRKMMGNKARIYAENEFDIKNVVIKHIQIYEALMVKSL
ncbi:glycosyltransferase family 4 protein [Vibrio astriarenae]